jgi:hypothetical protein
MHNLDSKEMNTLRSKLPELRQGWYALKGKEAIALCLRYDDDGTVRSTFEKVAKAMGHTPTCVRGYAMKALEALAFASKETKQDIGLATIINGMMRESDKKEIIMPTAPTHNPMVMSYNDEDFSTRDIGLVAALMCHGGKPSNVIIDTANRKAKFVFKDQPKMLSLMRQFHDEGLTCNAKQLLNYRFDIKSMVYDKCNQRGGVAPVQWREPSSFRKSLDAIPGKLVEPYDFGHT